MVMATRFLLGWCLVLVLAGVACEAPERSDQFPPTAASPPTPTTPAQALSAIREIEQVARRTRHVDDAELRRGVAALAANFEPAEARARSADLIERMKRLESRIQKGKVVP